MVLPRKVCGDTLMFSRLEMTKDLIRKLNSELSDEKEKLHKAILPFLFLFDRREHSWYEFRFKDANIKVKLHYYSDTKVFGGDTATLKNGHYVTDEHMDMDKILLAFEIVANTEINKLERKKKDYQDARYFLEMLKEEWVTTIGGKE